MTFLVTFLETVLVSAPSFSLLFYFQSQLTQKLFLLITHTPLPSVHFLYSYYINLLKKNPKQNQHSEAFWKWTSCWEMRWWWLWSWGWGAFHSAAGAGLSTPRVVLLGFFSPSWTFLCLSFVHHTWPLGCSVYGRLISALSRPGSSFIFFVK